MTTPNVYREESKDGSNPEETEPSAEEARLAMVKKRETAWKQGRTGTDRNRSLAAEQERQRQTTVAEASSNLAAREARDPGEELDIARTNAKSAFEQRQVPVRSPRKGGFAK